MSQESAAENGAGSKSAKKSGGGAAALVGMVLSAVLSGGAAFAGVRVASAHHAAPDAPKVRPPGATVVLDPFIANVPDAQGKPRAVKLTIAVELDADTKDEEFKVFIPRARDAVLNYFRGVSYEDLTNKDGVDKARGDLLEQLHSVGAHAAERVLITDLISQ